MKNRTALRLIRTGPPANAVHARCKPSWQPGVFRTAVGNGGAELWYVRGAGGAVPLHLYTDVPIDEEHPLVEAMYDYLDDFDSRPPPIEICS